MTIPKLKTGLSFKINDNPPFILKCMLYYSILTPLYPHTQSARSRQVNASCLLSYHSEDRNHCNKEAEP